MKILIELDKIDATLILINGNKKKIIKILFFQN